MRMQRICTLNRCLRGQQPSENDRKTRFENSAELSFV